MASEGDLKKSKVRLSTTSPSQVKQSTANLSMARLKKKSYGFGHVAAIKLMGERGSQSAVEFRRPPLIYTNTYQLETRFKFHTEQVTDIVETVLDDAFEEHEYNVQESPVIAMRIAGEVTRNCRSVGYNRYRIICVVTIGQKRAQSYNNAITFLWDHERDLYVDAQRETLSAFVQVTVFGIYLD